MSLGRGAEGREGGREREIHEGRIGNHPSLVPRPLHSFCRLQYEKRGRSGISYHVNDVEGRERS